MKYVLIFLALLAVVTHLRKKEKTLKGNIATIAIIIVAVSSMFIGNNSGSAGNGLTKDQFEQQLKTISDGKIDIGSSKISMLPNNSHLGLYFANWNGFKITAKVQDGKLIIPFSVITPPAGQMDEISLGQYSELAQDLAGIADPKLSVTDRESIIQNSLDFNNQVQNGTDNSTSKDGIKYELTGGSEPGAWFMFMAYDANQPTPQMQDNGQ